MSAESHGTTRSEGTSVSTSRPRRRSCGPTERRADELLDGLRALSHLQRSGLEARHVEEVADEPGQALRLVVGGLEELAPRRLVGGRVSSRRTLVAPVTTPSGVRKSCDTELRSALRSCSVSARSRARRASSASCGALDRRADEAGERLEELAVVGRRSSHGELASATGKEREHADAPLRSLERHDERTRRRQRVRPESGRLADGARPTRRRRGPCRRRRRYRRRRATISGVSSRPARRPRRERRTPRAGDEQPLRGAPSASCARPSSRLIA